ncbi:MAG: hypothetical protein H0V29_02735 [Thermoleophilaceae bacterium]|nr:hypothetical protein [Thermoleophilaceae bacterium]
MRRITLLLMLLAAAPAAHAADPAAPPGAPDDWLPAEAWVMERWLPYEESRFMEVFASDRGDLDTWLADDTRTLAQLARRRGIPVGTLAERLVAPRRGSVSPATYRVLVARAERTLTQGHLAQHMFFHNFHHWSVPDSAARAFGVAGKAEWSRLLRKGLSPLAIARRGGRTEARAGSVLLAALRRTTAQGVRQGAHTPRQARLYARIRRERLPHWLRDTRDGYGPGVTVSSARRSPSFTCRIK